VLKKRICIYNSTLEVIVNVLKGFQTGKEEENRMAFLRME
jgi:hypothetical protein